MADLLVFLKSSSLNEKFNDLTLVPSQSILKPVVTCMLSYSVTWTLCSSHLPLPADILIIPLECEQNDSATAHMAI